MVFDTESEQVKMIFYLLFGEKRLEPLESDLSEKFLGMCVGKLSRLFVSWWPRTSLGILDFFLSSLANRCTWISILSPTNVSQMYFIDSETVQKQS